MELNKERKIAMMKMRDQLVLAFNEFMKDISFILSENDDPTLEELKLKQEVIVRSNLIAQQIRELDIALNQLGFYQLWLQANPDAQEEAANRKLFKN